jgi:hypothetical protein
VLLAGCRIADSYRPCRFPPQFIISGENVNFNGNGHTFDGQGEKLWDSLGGNGGKDKVCRLYFPPCSFPVRHRFVFFP